MIGSEELKNYRAKWNRRLLNCLWFLFAMAVAIELFYLIAQPDGGMTPSSMARHLRYGLLNLAAVFAAEAAVRFFPKIHEYVIVAVSATLAVSVAVLHVDAQFLLLALFFPVLVSVFYFRVGLSLFGFGLAVGSFIALACIHPEIRKSVTLDEIIGISSILCIYSAVGIGVLLRGRDLYRKLAKAYDAQQQLLVRSIVMDKRAKTDALTDTYNHGAFQEYFSRLTEQSDSGNLHLHLALVDIDNFKQVNDTFGHSAGDDVLRAISGTVKSLIGPNDIAARYGGEELAVLITERSILEAYELMENIRSAAAEMKHPELNGQAATVSIGIASHAAGMSKEAFFRKADEALYEAKRSGKNRTVMAKART